MLAGLGALSVLGGLGLAGCGDDGEGSGLEARPGSWAPRSGDPRPNILLVVADDMRYDHLQFMPKVNALVGDAGRRFTQARCNVPLCQPSRVALFTGQMSRHNGELDVGFRDIALRDHDNCLAAWLADAGYRCGLFGKYVNLIDGIGGMPPPAGFHTWRELVGESSAYEFDVWEDERRRTISGVYSTDFLAGEALEFMQGSAEPFCCFLTPNQPHAPYWPPDELADEWSDFQWEVDPEPDVSDKPPWIQALAPLDEAEINEIQEDVRGVLRELTAVDAMVERLLGAMPAEVLDDTVVIFTSDNGTHHGEHRRRGEGTKAGPYEVGLHVPLLVRGPGFEPGPDIDSPSMVFQDIAATAVALAGATPGLPHQAGTSLVDLCARPDDFAERILLHEIGRAFHGVSGDGITTGPHSSLGFRKLYRYPSVREAPEGPFTYEAYDLDTDPDELSNWADDPARRAERDVLEAHLVQLLTA